MYGEIIIYCNNGTESNSYYSFYSHKNLGREYAFWTCNKSADGISCYYLFRFSKVTVSNIKKGIVTLKPIFLSPYFHIVMHIFNRNDSFSNI